MKRRTVVVSLLAFQLTLLGTIAPAIAGEWDLLGERSVRLVTERDVIRVSSRRQYSRIKLRVRETGIQILAMTITLGNGRTLNPPLRQFIARGGESRVIDLPGRDRVIRSVTLIYRSRPGSTERAIVRLYGRTR